MAGQKRVLVIGGSGFIGNSLVPMLVSKGIAVTLLNRGNRIQESTVQLIADRNIQMEMEGASRISGQFDAVIDTSAYTMDQVGTAWHYFSEKTQLWIHISSGAVYSNYQTERPHLETDEIGGAEIWGAYGRNKSEIDTFLNTRPGATRTIILRPPYIYGPGNDLDRETFIWSRAEAGLPVILPPNQNTLIQFLHVEDLAESIHQCLHHTFASNEIFNVAGDEIVTMKDWVLLLFDVCSRKRNPKIVPNTLAGYAIRDYFPFRDSPVVLDAERIKIQLGWRPKYKLLDGFARTYDMLSAQELERNLKKRSVVEEELVTKLAA